MLYHGVLAPHAAWRARVVAHGAPVEREDALVAAGTAAAAETNGPAARHFAWARLMRRAFEIDVLSCPRCGGRLRLMAILADLELRADLLDLAPP